MANIELKAYKISELTFKNDVNGKVQLHFNNKISHNVRYSGSKFCEATLTVEVYDNEKPDTINLKITIKGAFDILTDVQKEFIHVDTFKELYPMVKTIIATISGAAGIPPIIIKNFDIEQQEIYRVEVDPKKRPSAD